MRNNPTDIMRMTLLHATHLWAEFGFKRMDLGKKEACCMIE